MTPLHYFSKFGLTRVGPPVTKSWIRLCKYLFFFRNNRIFYLGFIRLLSHLYQVTSFLKIVTKLWKMNSLLLYCFKRKLHVVILCDLKYSRTATDFGIFHFLLHCRKIATKGFFPNLVLFLPSEIGSNSKIVYRLLKIVFIPAQTLDQGQPVKQFNLKNL